MWVSQTYLGAVEPNAKGFVYYLFEDYATEQRDFTELVQRKLEDMGISFGENISLLMPNPRYTARIEGEVREKLDSLWWSFNEKLPGLLFCTKPLSEFDARSGEYYFVSLPKNDVSKTIEALSEVRRLSNEHLIWQHKNRKTPSEKSKLKKLWEAIEAKPGFAGFRIDLKKLGSRD